MRGPLTAAAVEQGRHHLSDGAPLACGRSPGCSASTSLARSQSSMRCGSSCSRIPTVNSATDGSKLAHGFYRASGRFGWIPVLRRNRHQRRGCAAFRPFAGLLIEPIWNARRAFWSTETSTKPIPAMASGRSGFQSEIRYLMPRCETFRGFCRSWARLSAAWDRWAAGRPSSRGFAPVTSSGVRAYRCSLGTNTVLGLVTNGLLAVLPDGGAEN
jgi:hypothetical protein